MAKSKSDKKTTKKVLDEEEPISQATSAEVDIDVPESDLETDADADADTPDFDAGDDGGDNEEQTPALDDTPKPPKPKVTWLTIALIVLNWVAAPGFLVVAYMDHAMRTQYAFATLINHTQVWGVPLRDPLTKDADGNDIGEQQQPSASNESRPVMRFNARQLEDVFKKRPGVNAAMGKEFQPVEEPVPVRLRPSDMTEEVLDFLYGGVPKDERYATLEAAIDDLRKKLPGEIAKAAGEAKSAFDKKKDDDKRAFVQKSLFIMTWDPAEAKKAEDQIANAAGKDLDDLVKRALVQKILFPIALDYSDAQDDPTVKKDGKAMQRRIWLVDRIDETLSKAKGAELDALVDEAVQRRIYYDILAPLNLFRPGDLKITDIERIADRNKISMERVKELLDKRLGASTKAQYDLDSYIGKDFWGNTQDRDSVEKRQHIGFILFALAHVQVPVLDRKLYPKGIERAQTVSGLYEFTNASIAYVQVMRILERRMEERVRIDREGATLGPAGKEMRTPSIIDEQAAQIDRMHRMVEQVDAAQKRIAELNTQRDHFRKLYDQRVAQHKAVADKLILARKGTEKYVKELRELQDQLHAALLDLSDAADTNFRLEAEIRRLELSYFKTPMGGQEAAMINLTAKSLVLLHTVLSVAAMSWAIMHVLQAKDFGWMEPYKEVTEYDAEGNPKFFVRHASEIDKSQAALIEAKNTRDLTYTYVKPALEQIRENEAYLANNHLHYKAELKRLLDAPGELEVKQFKDGGYTLDTPTSNYGKPAQEEKPVPNIKKSYLAYQADLKTLLDSEKKVNDEIQEDTVKTKKLVFEMTGTDETNKYVQPGLYDLIDLEFKAQVQLKISIDEIKPHWSKAIENARLYQSRRSGLEETLEKLKKKPAPPSPPTPKLEKKVA